MTRKLLPVLVAAAAAAAVLVPVHLLADIASCSVNVSSFADTMLNPSRGEDTEFFVSTGGVPNIMFVLDTSSSMRRLPPDGASLGWGSFGSTYGCTNAKAEQTRFVSPCGQTTLENSRYNPNPGFEPPPYAEAKDPSGKYCPYMVSGNQDPATDKPGYDPDFYGGAGSSPWFFQTAKVYHDAIVIPDPFQDGWTDWTANPESYATYGDFCNQWSGTPAKATACKTCMRDQGYFFDGSYYGYDAGISCANTDECKDRNAGVCVKADFTEYSNADGVKGGSCRIPNVWFTGNFLNFYPPKFIVARKVLKDVLQSVRKVRLGLTIFNSSGNGGTLLEGLNPPCNLTGSPSNFDSNRGSILSAINSKTKVGFNGGTPLAETLLDVGQLYLNGSQTWFDSNYSDANFQEKSGQNKSMCFSCQASSALLITDGLPTYDGKIPGPAFATSPMTLAVANQAGSIAGMSGYNITGISTGTNGDCSSCRGQPDAAGVAPEDADTSIAAGACVGQQRSGACDDARNPIPSYLPKVAWYLNQLDFRPDAELGSDNLPFKKKQSITTYAIGLGARGKAAGLLSDTAAAGGGEYFDAANGDAKTVKDAILRVLEDVNTRSTSFGAASLSTLQIASSQGVLIPRFEPARQAHWDGHLYAFDLYSEFAGKCKPADPAVSGPLNGDYDCDGKCSSVFLKDKDGDFIQEDGTGAFRKNTYRDRAACGNGSLCSAAKCSGPDLTATGVAKPFWDAGSKLAPKKATVDPVSGQKRYVDDNDDFRTEYWARKIYTVVDTNGDKKLTSADGTIEFTAANAATLAPYLNLTKNYCDKLGAKLSERGATDLGKKISGGDVTACAEAVIDYIRGADVLNDRGCSDYPGSYCTRNYQLGDIFHSSPIEVWPPLASDSYSCPRGLHPQCLQSLFSGSISNPATVSGNANAYDDYAKDDRYKNRKKFVLVGANDGMLHAFRIERGTPADAAIAGEEIFGFIPPDLLPKLRLMVNENVHQFYVDATPMVRDVWMERADGNALGTANANGIREKAEFHTIAVVGERRGGTHYFALDVTEILAKGETTDKAYKPKFMWLYPQPNDPESLAFGETYVEFVPKPPPIGPVKIDRGLPPCPANLKEDPDGSGRCFEERWVVFLSGGFDPQFTKGRGVHMVSLDTGDELFDFSQPSGPANLCTATSDPRCHLNYPVAATVGMMMWGKQANFLSAASVNGYFDTATFGDIGGQLWVLRFNEPGKIDPLTNKVSNWYGARAFQHGLNLSTPACGLGYCDAQPFFYITSNVSLAANGLYRTLAGTGDRFNVLDPVGGTCGPDNIRACLLKGCTVTIGDGAGGPGAVYGVDSLLGTQSYSAQHPALCAAVDPSTYRYDVTAPSGTACTTVTSKIDAITITCPSTATCSKAAESTRKRASIVCTSAGCDAAASNEYGIPVDMKGNPDKLNWFFSILVFEKNGSRMIFRTADEAKAYDAARLKEGDLKNVNAADYAPTPANLASPEGKGWSYYFDHGEPSTKTPWTVPMAGVDHSVYRTDERAASVSTVEYGCAFWNTLQTGIPVGAVDPTTECPVASPCKAGRAQISYLYGANAGTGALCLKVNGADARAQQNETLVPPHIGKLVAYVGEGQVAFGLTSVRVPQGGANVQLGDVQDIAAATEWLPIDRTNHKCRHAPKETALGYTGPPGADVCRP